jgi:nucleoside-diphosphate-sugar epimerase
MPADVEMIAGDASDAGVATAAASGAAVVYQALNPPYHLWQELFPPLQAGAMHAASAAGARYVSIENLYMYDSSAPMSEDSAVKPRSKKGVLRAGLAEAVMSAHERGEVSATALRSSDYYGPGVVGSALGELLFGGLVAGKKALLSGSASQPHAAAYIEDVGLAAATLGTRDEAPGRAWICPHAPAQTQGQMVAAAAQALDAAPGMSVASPMIMRLAGLFSAGARASVEMMYEFTAPFLVDSSQMERAFALSPTSLDVGIARTVEWYRSRAAST